jgi:hypothetical protein
MTCLESEHKVAISPPLSCLSSNFKQLRYSSHYYISRAIIFFLKKNKMMAISFDKRWINELSGIAGTGGVSKLFAKHILKPPTNLMFGAAPVISLFCFRPHPFPVKSYRYLHNVGAALLAECGFVLAVFDLLESGFEGCFCGFAGAGFLAKMFQESYSNPGDKTFGS